MLNWSTVNNFERCPSCGLVPHEGVRKCPNCGRIGCDMCIAVDNEDCMMCGPLGEAAQAIFGKKES